MPNETQSLPAEQATPSPVTVILHRHTRAIILTLPLASFVEADLHGVYLQNANFHGADLYGANLTGANLTGANLHGANLHDADLRDADLTDADLADSDLHGANLHNADLYGANLHGANLHNADLHNARLRGANLHNASLRGANLTGCDLTGCDLTGCDLTGCDMRGADRAGAVLNEDENNDAILPSSAKPSLVPLGKGPHFLGVECEVESSPGNSVEVKASNILDFADGRAICKQDGSLSNGFEIVTSPMDLPSQQKFWGGLGATSHLRGLKSFDSTTCGLHVHCSRAPLTRAQIKRIDRFVNARRNRKFLVALAQRQAVQWSTYVPKNWRSAGVQNENRYCALNLNNAATIEFRVFKGTLKIASLLKAVEFCDALINFTSPASRSYRDSQSHVRFVEFALKQSKIWPHLCGWLQGYWLRKPDAKLAKQFSFAPVAEVENFHKQSNWTSQASSEV